MKGRGGRGRSCGREGEAAARLWAEGGFDVVHTHFAYAALGPLMALPRGVPHVRTFHGPWDVEGWLEDARGRRRPVGSMVKAIGSEKWASSRVEAGNLRRS